MKKWKIITYAEIPIQEEAESTTLYKSSRFNEAYMQFDKIKNAYAIAEGFGDVQQFMCVRGPEEFSVTTFFKGTICSKNVIRLILEKD